jgi:hypothetical protein
MCPITWLETGWCVLFQCDAVCTECVDAVSLCPEPGSQCQKTEAVNKRRRRSPVYRLTFPTSRYPVHHSRKCRISSQFDRSLRSLAIDIDMARATTPAVFLGDRPGRGGSLPAFDQRLPRVPERG